MTDTPNYIDINRSLWNQKTSHHLASDFYDVEGFLAGRSSLNQPELELLGDITGLSVLHLQCHFGQDTISMARMGAHVTGVDFSDEAIAAANDLATQAGQQATFICCNVYDLPKHLHQQYDIVYASYGVIGWLPDMEAWAQVVANFVKPGGRFVFVEFHPVMWMYSNDFTHIQYSYFNKEAIVETLEGTYADRNADIKATEIGWNHDLAEVMQALLNAGLSLARFREYDYSPYSVFHGCKQVGPGRYQLQGLEGKLPMMYSLVMEKK